MAELAARDPSERVELLLKMTRRLTELLDQETDLFETHRPQDTRLLQAEKQQLANIYRKETARIAQDKSLVSSAPQDRRAALAQATETFHESLERNRIAGLAMRQVTEGIVRAVADEVARTRAAPASYAPGQTPRPDAPNYNSSAITLNKSV